MFVKQGRRRPQFCAPGRALLGAWQRAGPSREYACAVWSSCAHLAERGEAHGSGQVLIGNVHASILRGQAQEAANAKDERDVQARDAKR